MFTRLPRYWAVRVVPITGLAVLALMITAANGCGGSDENDGGVTPVFTSSQFDDGDGGDALAVPAASPSPAASPIPSPTPNTSPVATPSPVPSPPSLGGF